MIMRLVMVSTAAYLLKSRTVASEKQLLLGNGSANTPVFIQWFSSRQVAAARDAHETKEELLQAVFSVRSVSRSYNEEVLRK
jgi:hypothetical protein